MKFICIYMIMYGFLLNLFQFLYDISMKPDYRCNLCYAGDTYLKSPNDTNAHYYFHTVNLKRTNPFTTIDYFNVLDTHSISMPAILMHSPDLPFQNIANDCFLTELTGVHSSRNDSTLDLINDHGHIDYSALGNIDPDTNILTDINLSLCDYYTEVEYNQCFQKNDQFSILNLNVRSLPKNIDAVKHFLAGLHNSFSILSFTETWLCEYNVFKSYLTNRKQFVNFQGTESLTEYVTCGVPQGSILGPLLFIIYINDLPNVTNKLVPILFADDTTLLIEGSNIHDIITTLNNELKLINNETV